MSGVEFNGWATDLVTGERERLNREQIRELHRLWWKHRGLRTRKVPQARPFEGFADPREPTDELVEAFQTALALDDARDERLEQAALL